MDIDMVGKLVALGLVVGLVEAVIILASVYLGFYLTKTAYTYNNPALGNPSGKSDVGMTVTPYDEDITDEIYASLGNLGEENEPDPVHEMVDRMLDEHGVKPSDTLGPDAIPSEPFMGDGVQEVEDDR